MNELFARFALLNPTLILTVLLRVLKNMDREQMRQIWLAVCDFFAKAAANTDTPIDDAWVKPLALQGQPETFGAWVDAVKVTVIRDDEPLVMADVSTEMAVVQAGPLGPALGELQADLEALPQAIDPATISLIIQAVLAIIEMWRKRKNPA